MNHRRKPECEVDAAKLSIRLILLVHLVSHSGRKPFLSPMPSDIDGYDLSALEFPLVRVGSDPVKVIARICRSVVLPGVCSSLGFSSGFRPNLTLADFSPALLCPLIIRPNGSIGVCSPVFR